jgi:hypothetical protein
MATFWYNKGREGFTDASISWPTNDIRVALVDKNLYNPAATTSDKFLDAISGISNAIIARMGAGLTGKTNVDGILDATDPTLTAVTGASVGAWVLYAWTGSDATSRLIAFVDNSGGLPFTPNGGDVTITFDNGANRIGKI